MKHGSNVVQLFTLSIFRNRAFDFLLTSSTGIDNDTTEWWWLCLLEKILVMLPTCSIAFHNSTLYLSATAFMYTTVKSKSDSRRTITTLIFDAGT